MGKDKVTGIPVEGKGYKGVILSARDKPFHEQVEPLGNQGWNVDLTSKDVTDAEKKASAYLETQWPEITPYLDAYSREYAGLSFHRNKVVHILYIQHPICIQAKKNHELWVPQVFSLNVSLSSRNDAVHLALLPISSSELSVGEETRSKPFTLKVLRVVYDHRVPEGVLPNASNDAIVLEMELKTKGKSQHFFLGHAYGKSVVVPAHFSEKSFDRFTPGPTRVGNVVVMLEGVSPAPDLKTILPGAYRFEISAGYLDSENAAKEVSGLIRTDDFTGIVFTAKRKAFGSEFGVTDFWTPTKKQVSEAEGALKKSLQKEHPKLVPQLPKYKRQYAGLVLKGQNILFMNFLHDDSIGDSNAWMENPIIVEDGGDQYFEAHYDIQKKKIVRIRVHGQA